METSKNTDYLDLVKKLESVKGLSVISLITIAIPHNYCL